jgi:hypothetical protein
MSVLKALLREKESDSPSKPDGATSPVKSAPPGNSKKPSGAPPSRAPAAKVAERSSALQPSKPKLVVPERDLSSVPRSLEDAIRMEGEGKNANEVLGILVDAHMKEAEAILARTILPNPEDVNTIADGFFIAKHGIGGIPELDHPIPEVSEWILLKLRALPSVKGKAREQFVEAWRSSQEQRAKELGRQEPKQFGS